MKVAACFSILISLLFSCNKDESGLIRCEVNCDSLHYDYEDGNLFAIYTYYQGQKRGLFVFFEDGDTIFGFDKRFQNYLKRTMRPKDKNTFVQLFHLNKNEYEKVETIVYTNSMVVDSLSDYLLIKRVKDNYRVSVRADYYNFNYLRIDMKDTSVQVQIDSTKDYIELNPYMVRRMDDNTSLFAFENDSTEIGHDESGIFYPLPKERLNRSLLKPD